MLAKSHLPYVLLSLLAAACARPFVPQTPQGYVELPEPESTSYDYRAAHPDGLVTAVRVLANDAKGDLGFWSRAIENEMTYGKGYRLIDKTSVRNRSGQEGQLLRFGHDEGSAPHLYRVALFVHDGDLFLLEQGGKAELLGLHEAELNRFISEFAIKTGLSRSLSYDGR